MDARGAIDRTFGHSKQARSLGKIHRVGRGRRKCVAILFASSLVVCAQNANGPSGHNDLATEEARALSTEDQTLSVRDANVILAFARTVLCHSETCCNKAYGPQGNAHCWDGVFKFDMCCNPKSEIHPYLRELYARRLSYHLRETTRDTQFGSAPLSRLGGGDWLLPQLPLHSQRDPRNCNAGTVVEDFSIVVMTRAAAFRAGIGRAWSILRTWARRMTEGTLAFAMEDDPVSVDATSLGELPGYFGGCLPLNHGVQGSFRTAASFHLVRRFADFDWLDAALFGDGHRFD